MSEFNFQKGLTGLAKAAEAIKLNQEIQLELEHGKIEQEEIRAKFEQTRLQEDRLEREAAKASLERQRALRYLMAEMEAMIQSLTKKLSDGLAGQWGFSSLPCRLASAIATYPPTQRPRRTERPNRHPFHGDAGERVWRVACSTPSASWN